MTRKPWLNLVFTVVGHVFTLLFLLLCAKLMEVFIYDPESSEFQEQFANMQVFILHCVLLALVSLVAYIVFFVIQRRKANSKKYLNYLGIFTRVILAISVLLVDVLLIVVFCLLPGEYNVPNTLFYGNIIEDQKLIFPLIVFVLLNLLPFIFLKPRP